MKQQLNGIDDLLKKYVSPLVGSVGIVIDIKSQLSPNIHLDIQKLIDAPPAPTNPILLIAKPKITIRGMGISKEIAPYGEPTKNFFPAVVLGVILSYLVTFYVGYKLGS